MKIHRVIICSIVLSSMVLGLASCSVFNNPWDNYRPYSEIKDEAYEDVSDIDPKDKGIFMKTVAGALNAIDDGDEDALQDLFCEELKKTEDIDDLTEEMVDGFEGDIIDTTPIYTDLAARTYGQFSKTEPVVYYSNYVYVYTDEQTYYMQLAMYAVRDDVSDGDDYVGINAIVIMTIDRYYDYIREEGNGKNGNYTSHYEFGDGTTQDMKFEHYCGLMSSYGDSEEYTILYYPKVGRGDVFRVTDTKDCIKRSELEDIDFEDDADELLSLEPYAMGKVDHSMEKGVEKRELFFKLKGDDDKLVYVKFKSGKGDPEIRKVIIVDVDYEDEYFTCDIDNGETIYSSN